MANKKPKSSKGKGSKAGGKKAPNAANAQVCRAPLVALAWLQHHGCRDQPAALLSQDKDPMKDASLQVTPQEKVNAVKPLWETLPQEERVKLLTIPTSTLRERVKQLTERAKAQAGALLALHPASLPSDAESAVSSPLYPGLSDSSYFWRLTVHDAMQHCVNQATFWGADIPALCRSRVYSASSGHAPPSQQQA
jgi:hypothetical protein